MKMRFLAILGIALASVLNVGCSVVDPGERAVKISKGELQSEVIQPGWYPYVPFWTDYVTMDVQEQKYKVQTDGFTDDTQTAQLVFTVNYRLDPSAVVAVYRDVGLEWEDKLIPQVILDVQKGIIGHYTAENLINERDVARALILEKVRSQLAPKGVIVVDFNIEDIDYSEKFLASVENKVVAEQDALAEVNRTNQNKEKNKQVLLDAQTAAQALQIRGNSISNNPKIIELERIEMLAKVGVEMAKNKAFPESVTIVGGNGQDNISMLLGMPTK